MGGPFIRPLAADARLLVELDEGTVNEVAPMAIRYLIDYWEAIAEAWKN